jgi:hypothetical protein
MAIAPLDPNVDPKALRSSAEATAQAKLKAVESVATPQTPEQHENGEIWSNSLDALIAGSGNPEVRAGVLRLLSTIPTVTVEHTVTDGRPTLQLTSRVFPDGYQEQLVIDAETGSPIRLIGGDIGQPPAVVVGYSVSRVTLADIANG